MIGSSIKRRWLRALVSQEEKREIGCYERLVDLAGEQEQALSNLDPGGGSERLLSIIRAKQRLLDEAQESSSRIRSYRAQLQKMRLRLPRGRSAAMASAGYGPADARVRLMRILRTLVNLEARNQDLLLLSFSTPDSKAQACDQACYVPGRTLVD